MSLVSGVLIDSEIPIAFIVVTNLNFFAKCSHEFSILEFETVCLHIHLYHVLYKEEQEMSVQYIW